MFLPFTDLGYEPQECHLNVRCHVKTHGGSVVNGWMIWDYEPFTFAEAEFHCVWRSPAGLLVDLTPKVDGESEILFLPDPKTMLRPGKTPGSVLCPCNRTTMPHAQYVWQGSPEKTSTVENVFHPSVHERAAQLGLDMMCILEMPHG